MVAVDVLPYGVGFSPAPYFYRWCFDRMNNLIYDSYSIFYQILQLIAPEHAGDIEFLLIGYTFSCLLLLLVIWTLLQMMSAFARAVLQWFYRGV